jgi:purine-binding chemotaxis protein CheW
MLGVINLRGAVMPVIDPRRRLGLDVTEVSSRHAIVVIQHGARLAGLLVDGVQETFQVDACALRNPPQIEAATPDRFVDAIIPIGERLLSRLVVSGLLPARRLTA